MPAEKTLSESETEKSKRSYSSDALTTPIPTPFNILVFASFEGAYDSDSDVRTELTNWTVFFVEFFVVCASCDLINYYTIPHSLS